MDLLTIIREFPTHERCRELLRRLRWPDGAACPRCAHTGVCWLNQQSKFECNSCHYQFSVTAGTIFHDSHLPLEKWFLAVHIMVESKKGVSAMQLQRMLGIGGYKTAWYLCHRIRAAMKEANPQPLKGTVEYDETWHGGRRKGMGKGYVGNKTTIMGAIERGGAIRLRVEKRVNAKTVTHFLQKNISPETERIYTDSAPAFDAVNFGDAEHEMVDHKAEEWVRGDVHTNSIESVWSLFKRSVIGAFHQVSEKHLQAYLDEFTWRFDRRKSERLFLDTLKALIHAPTLTFAKLTTDAEHRAE
jgi:transposase-like protein